MQPDRAIEEGDLQKVLEVVVDYYRTND